jgi:prolyl oligopeptidase
MKLHLRHPLALAVLALSYFGASAAMAADAATINDNYLWLEEVDSPRAMQWVNDKNAVTAKRLGALPNYSSLHTDAMAALTSTSRVPEVTQFGKYLYNLWQDQQHPRGVYRRATVEEFRKADTKWETIIDIDQLAKTEGKAWSFGGAECLAPQHVRCLINLSPGGGDAVEVREFDVETKKFVEGGFVVPVAKSQVNWRDADHVYVSTDFGPGSMTESGYARIVKLWKRGTPMASATTLYEGNVKSVSASAQRINMEGFSPIDLITEGLTFWTTQVNQIVDGKLSPLAIPPTARIRDGYKGRLVLWLKADWAFKGQSYPAGAVMLADPSALRGGEGKVEMVVAPSARSIVRGVQTTPTGLLVTTLDDVRGKLTRYVGNASGWTSSIVPFPDNGTLNVQSVDDTTGDAIVQFQSFLTPPALYHFNAKNGEVQQLKTQVPTFDGSRFEVTQNWTVSKDGTKVPYFVVGPKGMKLDGKNPVWMFSYGGFENALTPTYSGSYEDMHGAYGKMWLERGGVFVLANIRGGGEFGPSWHTSALKENHVKSFEDFEAIAADIAKRKISSPAHIGIEGRSNGGLLVSATMVRHPELYGAVVCGNPLIDMRRYHKLLAGASWVGEYGDPDVPAQWEYISLYSPYQKVSKGMPLPPVMFYSTTRDDRVHPAHARKMAAKMEELGYPVEYFENIEGGHHGPVVIEQTATRIARTFAFLWQKLK